MQRFSTRHSTYVSPQGFSIIEVLVGIFIFSLGLVSIYSLLVTSLRVNDYNSNSIIASNLSQQQIELIRNIRDTNYATIHPWDNLTEDGTKKLTPGQHYSVSQNRDTGDISVEPITGFVEGESELSNMQNYRMCEDDDYFYIYCFLDSSAKKTPFYAYIYVEPGKDKNGNTLTNAYEITSRVIWYKRGYYEFDTKTILADWNQL